MRRRKPPGGAREALAAEYRYLAVQLDDAADGWFARFADRIDAGEPVEVRAYEVDLLPPNDMVRVESDGTIVRLATWRDALSEIPISRTNDLISEGKNS